MFPEGDLERDGCRSLSQETVPDMMMMMMMMMMLIMMMMMMMMTMMMIKMMLELTHLQRGRDHGLPDTTTSGTSVVSRRLRTSPT